MFCAAPGSRDRHRPGSGGATSPSRRAPGPPADGSGVPVAAPLPSRFRIAGAGGHGGSPPGSGRASAAGELSAPLTARRTCASEFTHTLPPPPSPSRPPPLFLVWHLVLFFCWMCTPHARAGSAAGMVSPTGSRHASPGAPVTSPYDPVAAAVAGALSPPARTGSAPYASPLSVRGCACARVMPCASAPCHRPA
jgi:hypothetical protein